MRLRGDHFIVDFQIRFPCRGAAFERWEQRHLDPLVAERRLSGGFQEQRGRTPRSHGEVVHHLGCSTVAPRLGKTIARFPALKSRARLKRRSAAGRSPFQKLIKSDRTVILWVGLFIMAVALQITAAAEDGYRLWLRYDPLPKEMIEVYRPRVTSIVAPGGSATLEAIRSELANGCAGLLGGAAPVSEKVERDGAVVVGTPKSSLLIAGLKWDRQLSDLGPEGFRIRSLKLCAHSATVIASDGEIGALY